jgi:hypothetical protein
VRAQTVAMRTRRSRPAAIPRSAFAGFCFPPDVRPMRGLRQDRSARVVIAGHAFVQNVRRAHYELAVEEPMNRRLAAAFDELALAI